MDIIKTILLSLSFVGIGSIGLYPIRNLISKYGISFYVVNSFIIGFGFIGWISYYALLTGLFGFNFVIFFTSVGLFLLILLILFFKNNSLINFSFDLRSSIVEYILLGLIICFSVLDIIISLAPPSNADSLGYHYYIAKIFSIEDNLVFFPRAATGAVPLIIQTIYAYVYEFSGELGMTLMGGITKLVFTISFYCLSRNLLERKYALMITAVVISIPAIVYGGSNGDVDLRLGLFVISAFSLFFVWRSLDSHNNSIQYLLFLIFVVSGFYAAGKYYGLFFLFSFWLYFLKYKRPRYLFIASAGAILAAHQWYVWNFINTGDPFFPILFEYIGQELTFWSNEQNSFFKMLYRIEQPVSNNILWYLSYPFRVHLIPLDGFHALRIGPGFFLMLIFPFSLYWLAKNFKNPRLQDNNFLVLIPIIFYTLWFFIGSSQRFRYLLPIYPIFILYFFYLYNNFVNEYNLKKRFFYLIPLFFVLSLQSAAYALYSAQPIKYFFDNSYERSQYVVNNVPWVSVIFWANQNLPENAFIYSDIRQHRYFSDRKIFIGQPILQDQIKIRPTSSLEDFLDSTRLLGITHYLTRPALSGLFSPKGKKLSSYESHMVKLFEGNCLTEVERVQVRDFGSRSLKVDSNEYSIEMGVYTLIDDCAK